MSEYIKRESAIEAIMSEPTDAHYPSWYAEKVKEIPASDVEPVRKWIPVTERLPEEDGDYLVFKRFAGNAWSDVVSFAKDGRQVSECTFVEKWQNVWYYYDSEWGYIRTDAVTHWMPLPEPPEKAINQDHNKGKENDYGNQSE